MQKWFSEEICTTPVSAAKRRLDLDEHDTIEIGQLPGLGISQEARVPAEIEDIVCEIDTACKQYKTGVITLMNETFCSKCNKETVAVQTTVFNTKLKIFSPHAKLFQDNAGCLLKNPTKITSQQASSFLIMKRSKNVTIDNVLLDIDFLSPRKLCSEEGALP